MKTKYLFIHEHITMGGDECEITYMERDANGDRLYKAESIGGDGKYEIKQLEDGTIIMAREVIKA